jgi:hypothetical protein
MPTMMLMLTMTRITPKRMMTMRTTGGRRVAGAVLLGGTIDIRDTVYGCKLVLRQREFEAGAEKISREKGTNSV